MFANIGKNLCAAPNFCIHRQQRALERAGQVELVTEAPPDPIMTIWVIAADARFLILCHSIQCQLRTASPTRTIRRRQEHLHQRRQRKTTGLS